MNKVLTTLTARCEFLAGQLQQAKDMLLRQLPFRTKSEVIKALQKGIITTIEHNKYIKTIEDIERLGQ